MTPERYRAMWNQIGTTKVDPPIAYTCPKCQYPGQITRVCDVPSFCLYCGRDFGLGETERLKKLVVAQQDRQADAATRAWVRSWVKPATAEVAR